MKAKTARRFLSRNQVKMFKREFNYNWQPPSFVKRWKECVRVLIHYQSLYEVQVMKHD